VKTILIVLVTALFFLLWQKLLPIVSPLICIAYLLYGFIRPFISRRMQREIEVDDEDDDDDHSSAV
jgi:CDP-diacylglycerol--serine O-phosphatidyltransferase